MLTTDMGKGTNIIMRLPLTVAIIHALLVKASGDTFAFPLSKVLKSAEVEKDVIQRSQNQRIVLLNGEMIRLYHLNELLGLGPAVEAEDFVSFVITEVGGKSIGLEVEEIVGSQEVFIKSLGHPLETIPGFSGVTILGDGKPVLILDVANLF
jgi:two-component system chemotaxis sensor kinase CheA